MGYTHYWYREIEIENETFENIVRDFEKILPLFKVLDIKLANGLGEGEPIVNENEVLFNGSAHCGHPKVNLGIAWPANNTKNGVAVNGKQAVVGTWFAGAKLNQRTCGGDCSHETFSFPRVMEYSNPCHLPLREEEKGQHFNFCKTAYKPYDLAVTVFLVIAKHYLGDKIKVSSDGEVKDWLDAVNICQKELGYGEDFVLRD